MSCNNRPVVRSVGGRGDSACLLKFAILGEKQVGKTSLVSRYTRGSFSATYIHTRGGDITEKKLIFEEKSLHLSIIDSAGHKYVRSVIKSLYRDVHAIMLVFDVTRKSSFECLNEWVDQISIVNPNDPVVLLVGNKADLTPYRQVDTQQAAMYAERQGMMFFEASAKTGHCVVTAFQALIQETVHTKIPAVVEGNVKLEDRVKQTETKKMCCNG